MMTNETVNAIVNFMTPGTEVLVLRCGHISHIAGADPNIFKGVVEEENFERKMFVGPRIDVFTLKNQKNMQLFLSSSISRRFSSIFFMQLFFN